VAPAPIHGFFTGPTDQDLGATLLMSAVEMAPTVFSAWPAPRGRRLRTDGCWQAADLMADPGRTRTCDKKAAMSGRRSIGFVDFAAVSFALHRFRCA